MAPVVSDVQELRALISSRFKPEYRTKMLHSVPEWPTVKSRVVYLLGLVKGRRVLDIGCCGDNSRAYEKAAGSYRGVDKAPGPWAQIDLDAAPEALVHWPDVDLILCSEVLEHLANPGRFLAALAQKYRGVEACITVPNAGAYTVVNGCEMVNRDHVAWYSYTTLRTLLERYGYEILDVKWYNGQPHKAEGLIVLAKP